MSTVLLGVVWMMAWGRYDLPTLLMGLAFGVVVAWVFPLPPLRFVGTLRPWWWLVLVVRVMLDLSIASVGVAWAAVVKGPRMRNAIIAVRLRTPSDFVLAQTVELTTLVPGSVVLETRRPAGDGRPTIYVHVMDIGDDTIEEVREGVRRVEARVIRAFGTREEFRALRAERSTGPAGEPATDGDRTEDEGW